MKNILYLWIIIMLVSCSNKIESVERAFYYWQSDEWSLSKNEIKTYNDLKTQKLYIKLFEVDHNSEIGNYPISKSRLGMYYFDDYNIKSIIPTIYIKNVVFLKSSKEELVLLAENVDYLIKSKSDNFKGETIREYQMDCDWTPKSKDNYFYFLNQLKTISNKEISCTLRLYPYKYPDKMGIPPVDKVMLMCYNLINPLENPNKNSILDLSELKSYLRDAKAYPKHLDIALPIYSWAHLYHNERFSEILNTDVNKLKKSLKREKQMWYTVIHDTVIHNTYLRIGDKIKLEEVDVMIIRNVIALLKQFIVFDKNTTVALFHLDEEQLNNYSNEELSSFYTAFSK